MWKLVFLFQLAVIAAANPLEQAIAFQRQDHKQTQSDTICSHSTTTQLFCRVQGTFVNVSIPSATIEWKIATIQGILRVYTLDPNALTMFSLQQPLVKFATTIQANPQKLYVDCNTTDCIPRVEYANGIIQTPFQPMDVPPNNQHAWDIQWSQRHTCRQFENLTVNCDNSITQHQIARFHLRNNTLCTWTCTNHLQCHEFVNSNWNMVYNTSIPNLPNQCTLPNTSTSYPHVQILKSATVTTACWSIWNIGYQTIVQCTHSDLETFLKSKYYRLQHLVPSSDATCQGLTCLYGYAYDDIYLIKRSDASKTCIAQTCDEVNTISIGVNTFNTLLPGSQSYSEFHESRIGLADTATVPAPTTYSQIALKTSFGVWNNLKQTTIYIRGEGAPEVVIGSTTIQTKTVSIFAFSNRALANSSIVWLTSYPLVDKIKLVGTFVSLQSNWQIQIPQWNRSDQHAIVYGTRPSCTKQTPLYTIWEASTHWCTLDHAPKISNTWTIQTPSQIGSQMAILHNPRTTIPILHETTTIVPANGEYSVQIVTPYCNAVILSSERINLTISSKCVSELHLHPFVTETWKPNDFVSHQQSVDVSHLQWKNLYPRSMDVFVRIQTATLPDTLEQIHPQWFTNRVSSLDWVKRPSTKCATIQIGALHNQTWSTTLNLEFACNPHWTYQDFDASVENVTVVRWNPVLDAIDSNATQWLSSLQHVDLSATQLKQLEPNQFHAVIDTLLLPPRIYIHANALQNQHKLQELVLQQATLEEASCSWGHGLVGLRSLSLIEYTMHEDFWNNCTWIETLEQLSFKTLGYVQGRWNVPRIVLDRMIRMIHISFVDTWMSIPAGGLTLMRRLESATFQNTQWNEIPQLSYLPMDWMTQLNLVENPAQIVSPDMVTGMYQLKRVQMSTQGQVCGPGTFRSFFQFTEGNVGVCIECPAGFICDDGLFTTPCPIGTWNNQTRRTRLNECTACPKGFTTSSTGANDFGLCIATLPKCVAGRYGYDCVLCPLGQVSDGNRLECSQCPEGSMENGFRTECVSCPSGTYQPDQGQTQCRSCPRMTFSTAGSSGCMSCFQEANVTFENQCEEAMQWNQQRLMSTNLAFATPVNKTFATSTWGIQDQFSLGMFVSGSLAIVLLIVGLILPMSRKRLQVCLRKADRFQTSHLLNEFASVRRVRTAMGGLCTILAIIVAVFLSLNLIVEFLFENTQTIDTIVYQDSVQTVQNETRLDKMHVTFRALLPQEHCSASNVWMTLEPVPGSAQTYWDDELALCIVQFKSSQGLTESDGLSIRLYGPWFMQDVSWSMVMYSPTNETSEWNGMSIWSNGTVVDRSWDGSYASSKIIDQTRSIVNATSGWVLFSGQYQTSLLEDRLLDQSSRTMYTWSLSRSTLVSVQNVYQKISWTQFVSSLMGMVVGVMGVMSTVFMLLERGMFPRAECIFGRSGLIHSEKDADQMALQRERKHNGRRAVVRRLTHVPSTNPMICRNEE